jgi:endonuclease-8
MPEGDSLRRTAERLSILVGERLAVDAPHPRAAALGLAAQLDGRVLERVEAVGKNLILTFEGDVTLRSHLMMRGRWHVEARCAGDSLRGTPWLVLGGRDHRAVLWHGPVLELGRRALERLGPDVMDEPVDVDAIRTRLRETDQGRAVAEALLDQRLVAGIGNLWRSEALYLAGLAPLRRLEETTNEELERTILAAHDARKAGRARRWAYGRAGHPCRRCGTPIRTKRLGDWARAVYWCPVCQPHGVESSR